MTNLSRHHETVARDFLGAGYKAGDISEKDIAVMLVEIMDYDVDAVKRLIKCIKEEQIEYLEDWYDEDEVDRMKDKVLEIKVA